MDILELLNGELSDKDWTLSEKARYLYIRSCELFTYDARYDFLDLFPDVLVQKKKLRSHVVNVRELEDNRVVCTSYSYAFRELLEELLGISAFVFGNRHSWVKFDDTTRMMEADATVYSDLARVKMKCSTRGYFPIQRDCLFTYKLKEMDQEIGYLSENYENEVLQQYREKLWQDFKRRRKTKKISMLLQEDIEYLKWKDDFFVSAWKEICKFFEKYHLQQFTDAEYAISYLEHKFIGDATFLNSHTTCLYQVLNDDIWEFLNIYPVVLHDDIIYYSLEERDNKISFGEMSRADALYYTDFMDGKRKELIR